MNYAIGDTVVCIDAKPVEGCSPTFLVRGNNYTVRSIDGRCVTVIGGRIPRRSGLGLCHYCRCVDDHWHYFGWRFIKLDRGELGVYELEVFCKEHAEGVKAFLARTGYRP